MTSLCSEVLNALKGKTLVTAESLTGGGIGAALTAIPGSSEVYKGGIICYTNWVKQNILGVPEDLLETHGAVSLPVAQAMAEGAKKLLSADVAVSVTGLAGPGGGTEQIPVGTVYIGCDVKGKVTVREYHFSGNRSKIRENATAAALILMRRCVLEYITEVSFGKKES